MSGPPPTAERNAASGSNIYIAFVPWVLFSVITQHDEVRAAAVVALVAAVAISVPSLLAGRPKVLELGTIVAFIGFTIVALTADEATRDWLARYARGISAGLLALIAFSSLLWTPFTEQYARESVPQEFWGSPRFKEINHRLTAIWGFVFLLMVPSHIAAGLIDTRRGNTFFNWVIPIGLVVLAVKQTARITEEEDDVDDGPRSGVIPA
jgi:cytochrome bd-type quinol oxidase subunit 2